MCVCFVWDVCGYCFICWFLGVGRRKYVILSWLFFFLLCYRLIFVFFFCFLNLCIRKDFLEFDIGRLVEELLFFYLFFREELF